MNSNTKPRWTAVALLLAVACNRRADAPNAEVNAAAAQLLRQPKPPTHEELASARRRIVQLRARQNARAGKDYATCPINGGGNSMLDLVVAGLNHHGPDGVPGTTDEDLQNLAGAIKQIFPEPSMVLIAITGSAPYGNVYHDGTSCSGDRLTNLLNEVYGVSGWAAFRSAGRPCLPAPSPHYRVIMGYQWSIARDYEVKRYPASVR